MESWEGWSEVLGSGLNLLIPQGGDKGPAGRFPVYLAKLVGRTAGGPTAVVPFSTGRGDIGHLAVQWQPGQEDAASTALPGLATFAQLVARGLVAARAQHDRQLLAMLEDRDRIARDMHDHVIQRLFATGLSLQAAERLAVHPVVRSRLDEAVNSLDEAIKDIRSTIFELRSPTQDRTLHEELQEIVRSAGVSLGFTPTLELAGGPEPDDAGLRGDLLAVVREALANVSRHAQAGSASVVVTFGTSLSVTVTDDGVGIGTDDRRSGLANLGRRAAARSGTFHVSPSEPRGTELVWTVPL
jgi:signal transduction histidine kinase